MFAPVDFLVEARELLSMVDSSAALLKQSDTGFLAPVQRNTLVNMRKLLLMARKKVQIAVAELSKPQENPAPVVQSAPVPAQPPELQSSEIHKTLRAYETADINRTMAVDNLIRHGADSRLASYLCDLIEVRTLEHAA